jgi:hypothetical protein
MEIFDDSWINDYEILEKEYSSFYKEPVDSIKLHFIYINQNNEIDTINQDDLMISSKIEKDRVYQIIKENKCKNNMQYKLVGLLKYNISLEPYHIKHFLEDTLDNDMNHYFLIPLNKIEDIIYEDTITLFKDLNSLYFIFYDNTKQNNDLFHSQTQIRPNIIPTKKIRINLKPKKTKKR